MVNYVKHDRGVMYKMEADRRIRPNHISLYRALFQTWNEFRFQNPMRIYRDEMMSRAKLRNRETYAKCMRELAEWGYIGYDGAVHAFEPCLVVLYRFDVRTGPENKTKLPTDTRSVPATNTATDHRTNAPTHTINSINTTNISNAVNADEQAQAPADGDESSDLTATASDVKEKQEAPGGGGAAAVVGKPERVPASLEVVYPFFEAIKSTRAEAEKFFHHFTANGWLVGGRSPMRNWQAAARNWVANAVNFTPRSRPTPGALSSPKSKNLKGPL